MHVAVKKGNVYAVKLLLPFSSDVLFVRDANGSTPFHAAVQHGRGIVVKTLLEVYPQSILYIEDGVGATPLETATLHHLLPVTRDDFNFIQNSQHELTLSGARPFPRPFAVERLERELPRLRDVLDELRSEGKLTKGSKLSNSLFSFLGMMEGRLPHIKTQRAQEENREEGSTEEAHKREERDRIDQCDWPLTYHLLSQHYQTKQQRQLVHLLDTQKCVEQQLQRSADAVRSGINQRGHDEEGLDEEESDEKIQQGSTIALQRTHLAKDEV